MKIIVIGAGASGLMVSNLLAEKGHEVLLFDKNEKAGRKIYITGKGRCNLTNTADREEFLANVVTNAKFLYPAVSEFNYESVMDFFAKRGVELEVQRGNRVFPRSMKSTSIIDCLVWANKKAGTKFHYSEEVKSVMKEDEIFRVRTSKSTYVADKVIIATGGLSYPVTGSTGDGYRFAKMFGLDVVAPVPALSALKIKEKIPDSLNAFTLKNVTLNAKTSKKSYAEFGELTFYSYGVAGPIALAVSSSINRVRPEEITLTLDLKPALSEEQIHQRILREIQEKKYPSVKELLLSFLPSEFYDFFIALSHMNEKTKLSELTKEERNRIVAALKSLPMTYIGLDDIARAVVTSGGVNVREINGSTFEAKKVPGLYFIGEVLDVDAYTGGFNLQIAWSTAMKLASKF